VAPRQTRYKVTDRPDARTIRYYINQNLLPKPVSYEGGRARYSGQHVIRLLAIKRLQADHLTLSKIKSILAHTPGEEVLDLIAPAAPEPRLPEPSVEASRAAEVEPCMRFRPEGGGSVDIPQRTLADREGRNRIVSQLLAIAQVIKDQGAQP
jgi:DNA-binding transcriptional MerR regulator